MRVIRNHGADPTSAGERLDSRCVRGCWFELHRQGGCGPAELRLDRGFEEDADLAPGDWLSVSAEQGGVETRLYLGRVEHWEVEYPAGVRVRLGGMVNELGEVFVGGFGGPGEPPPHRLGRTDLFTDDPDRPVQSYEPTERVSDLAAKLVNQYVLPRTSVMAADPIAVAQNPPVDSATFRGEESVRSILKDLAVRAGNVDWGVDAFGTLFFRPGPTAVAADFRAGREVTKLAQTRSRDVLFNRLQITGDYVYDRPHRSGAVARPSHRSRYHFVDDGSLSAFGEHRLRLWLPWVRTRHDAEAFAGPFFERYGRPVTKTLIEAVLPEGSPVPTPWGGPVEVRDEAGLLLAVGSPEVVRVRFDEAVVVRMEVGPEDPRRLWPEPREDERYEIPPRSELSTEGPKSSLYATSVGGPGGPGPGTSPGGGGSSAVPTSTALTSLSSADSATSPDSPDSPDSWESSGWRSSGSDWTTWRTWSSGESSWSSGTGEQSTGVGGTSGLSSSAVGSSFGSSNGSPESSPGGTSAAGGSSSSATSSRGDGGSGSSAGETPTTLSTASGSSEVPYSSGGPGGGSGTTSEGQTSSGPTSSGPTSSGPSSSGPTSSGPSSSGSSLPSGPSDSSAAPDTPSETPTSPGGATSPSSTGVPTGSSPGGTSGGSGDSDAESTGGGVPSSDPPAWPSTGGPPAASTAFPPSGTTGPTWTSLPTSDTSTGSGPSLASTAPGQTSQTQPVTGGPPPPQSDFGPPPFA